MRAPRTLSANEDLLDQQIFDVAGEPVGRVDDLELTEPDGGGPPVLTALLCGPTALGPRIGGRIGTWWLAIGRRLRARDDPYPNRIPVAQVSTVGPTGITLSESRDTLDTDRFRDWARDKIVARIPGSGPS
jgi:sporulation protein YlmC with PRC-barrel domain